MMLSRTSARPALLAARGRRTTCVTYAKQQKSKQSYGTGGYVETDNSGRGNMFPELTKSFYSSPTSERAARQGLGGAQGGAVLAGALALVGLATATVVFQGTGETLNQVQGTSVESLTAIADRIAASL